MLENLMRAGCYVLIIVMGYLLRRFGFFKDGDFTLLSRIVLKITLPAAIISNFAGKTLDFSVLTVALVGFGANLVYVAVGWLIHRRQGRELQAFGMQNLSGYNIGNFTIPFIQSFLGSPGVIAASLFDVGNSIFSTGGSYSLAALVKNGVRFSVPRFLKSLIKSVPFDVYVIMTIVALLKIPLPGMLVTFSDIVGSANIFLGMLMLGVGLRLPNDLTQFRQIAKILGVRYGLGIIFTLILCFLLPFTPEVRKTIILIFFAPVASAVPAFTGELGCDVGLSSAINSISVICSMAIIVFLLTVMI